MFGRILAAALSALLFAIGATARAGEKRIEDLSTAQAFAPRWAGGSLSEGRDAKRHWLEVRVEGAAGKPANVLVENRSPYAPALDLRGRFLKLWIRIDDLAHLGGMEFRLGSDDQNYFAFSFIRYADRDSNVVREGVWTALTFPFASAKVKGAPDRGAIQRIGWYVTDAGNGPLIARWGGMAAVDEPGEGAVSFSFDDGYDDDLWAAEQMAKYGMRATAYIIPAGIGKPGYMTEAQLVQLRDRFGWEIAAHHETPFTDFAPDQLEPRIREIQGYLTRLGFARGARHLAYPLGRQEPLRIRPTVARYFDSARVAGGGLETLPPADRHLLRVLNVTRSTSPDELVAAARSAREDRHWLILMFHMFVDQPSQDTEYAKADFTRLIEGVGASRARVIPLIDVVDACGKPSVRGCRLPQQRSLPASH